MKKTVLIMAGGRGERFWPRSRISMPKQFLPIIDEQKTMLQMTVERVLPIVDIEDVFVVTNREYSKFVYEQLPDIPKENVLCEPVGRNTAPCIGLGAVHIEKKYGDAVMIVLPADHIVKHRSIFLNTLSEAAEVAEEGRNLVTIGIAPDYPETGYGYIKYSPDIVNRRAYAVECFAEKPDLETAKKYLYEGMYLWNSGMFIWKASSILSCIRDFLPDTYEGLETIKASIGTAREAEVLNNTFTAFKSVSVDYGIMEKAKDIYVISGAFTWDDIGSWLAIERMKQSNEFGNVLTGRTAAINTKNCIIEGKDKLIACIGLEDLVVVDSDDALLICKKDDTGDIKKLLELLRIGNQTQYL